MSQLGGPAAMVDSTPSIVDLLHRCSQVAEDHFARTKTIVGVTARQFAVLAAVARAPDVNQTDLVSMTGVDRSTMADIVRRLVQKELLHRRRTKEDARAYAISLTPKATALIEQLKADMTRTDEELLASFSDADRDRLVHMLHQIIAHQQRQDAPLPEQRNGHDDRPAQARS